MAKEPQTETAAKPTTKEITIAGEKFTISMPYGEGHKCTTAEAKALNQTRAENLRNNMAKLVKAAKEDGTLAEMNGAVTKYDKEYEFTLASVGGSRTMDPVEKEAKVLAREMIKQKLAADNRKLSDIPKDKLAEAVAKLADQDKVVSAAKKRVTERQKLAEDSLASIGM